MKIPLAALLVLTVAACSQAPQPDTAMPPPAVAASSATAAAGPAARGGAIDATATLAQFHWQLASATDPSGRRIDALFVRADKPLQLDFDAGGVSISNTCNRMHGEYSITDGKLVLGNLASTLMACGDPALTALDRAVGQYLHGTLDLALDASGARPMLTLTTPAGDTLAFAGVPTAETRFGSKGTTVFLEVAAQARPCDAGGTGDAQCLEVRQLHYGSNGVREGEPGEWHVLDGDIEGYTHQPGVRNVLRVKRHRLSNPPANASSVAYVLDMVVETELPPHQ